MELVNESNFNESNETSNVIKSNDNHGWQKVTYSKRQRKLPAKQSDSAKPGSAIASGDGVFQTLEKQSDERRRRLEAQKLATGAAYEDPIRSSRQRSDDEDDDSDAEFANSTVQNGNVDEKKTKVKKPKKPKVTIVEAAAKIDASDLEGFLADVSASFESHQDIQLMRFADYFGRAFSAVNSSQFPWTKLFREATISKIADVPVSHISEPVYKTSVDWINNKSYEALGSFVLWCLDSILADFASQQAGAKTSKKSLQQTTSKSQVAMFVVVAMVLRRKPDVLIGLLPTLKEKSKYQGQDKLPLIAWILTQASQGDLAVGLYSWSHHVLPILGGKSGSNPQTRDLVLQLVERILSAPKARIILVNGAVRKGERLVDPTAFDLLLRVTFPASVAKVKATERFVAVYPTLKEVALAGSAGSKAMKQVSNQILTLTLKAASEGIPDLSQEATNICISCLTLHSDCYKQWEKVYMDNLVASVAILRKLNEEWKSLSVKQSSLEALGEILRSFRHKNEKAVMDGERSSDEKLIKESDKYCKVILGKLSRGTGCMKGVGLVIFMIGIGIAVMPQTSFDSLDLKKLSLFFSDQLSF